MKNSIIAQCAIFLVLLCSTPVCAYDFKVDGLCYNKLSDNTVELTWEASYTPYTGDIIIPKNVNYNGKKYEVVAIGVLAMANKAGENSFQYNEALTSITIPNSVTSIGDYAFVACSGLTSITIPNSVTTIGDFAFYGCSSLKNVISEIKTPFVIKENIFSVYTTASLTVPKGTKSVYQSTYYWNKFTNIVEASEDNSSTKRTIHVATAGTLPDLISESEKYTIEELTLTGELNGTDFRLLRDMAGNNYLGQNTIGKLRELDLSGAKIVVGGEYYLYTNNITGNGCNTSGSFHHNITNNNDVPKRVFFGCYLEKISIPESASSIGEEAFKDCRSLTSITIPGSMTSIGEKAFDCSGLTSITIPSSVTSIGVEAFYYCRGLTSITIPNSVTSISSGVFSGCSGLTSITIPSNVRVINSYAFYGCSGLSSIAIPSSVTSIGNEVFYGCSGLKDVISEIKTPFEISENVFSVYSDAILTVPKGTKSAYQSTNYWNKFSNIVEATEDDSSTKRTIHVATAGTLPDLISESEKYNIEELTLTGELNGTDFRLLRDMAGCNYLGESTSGKLTVLDLTNAKIVVGGEKYLDTNNISGNGVQAGGSYHYDISKSNVIPDYAFFGCYLKEMHIPNSVTSIGYDAFSYCHSLTSITIPNSVTSIGNNAFYGCSGLTSITIPNSMTSIGSYVFSGCSGLTSITIPSSVTRIGSGAFSGCSGLTSIKVESVNTVYDSRNNCNAIIRKSNNELVVGCKNTIIPNSVTSIGVGAFYGCSGLTSITIPNSVTSIGSSAFIDCSGLTSLSISNSVTSIGDYAFQYCSSLTSLSIPNSVTSIGSSAFYGCSGLKDIISEIKTPFEIKEGVFSVYSTATLTVPKGTKAAYQSTNYWNKFSNIVEAQADINEEWLAELQAIRDEAQTNVEKIDSLLSLGDWYDGHAKDMDYISYQTLLLLNDISSVEEKINSGEATINDINVIRDRWRDLFVYYDISPMELTITSRGNGYVGVGYGIKVRNTLKHIRYLYPKPWNGFTIEIKPDKDFMVDSIVVNGKRTEQTLFGNGEISGELVVVFKPADEAQLVLTANNYTREYGDYNPNFGYTTSGGTLNGTPQITCSATETSPVGTYPITISKGSVTNGNVTYVNGTLTITKASLTITAKSYTRQEGEANPTFEVTYSGFKNGETSSVLNQKPTCSTSATSSSSPGTYDIIVSGAEAQNYSISYVKGILTITKRGLTTFTKDVITYTTTNNSQNVEVTAVGSNSKNLEIPSSVSYDGKSYSVTSIKSGAFDGLTLNYLSIPSSVTSLENSIFSKCDLGAMIWKANNALSYNVFSNAKFSTASNFLLYVNSASYAPSNVKNVVIGTSANTILLSDNGGNFYCPKEFTAQTISYTHNYSMTTGGSGKGWETLALPFDVQKIEHKTKGTLTPFAKYNSADDSQRPFWLYDLGSNGFKRTDAIKANTPYIIAMPNDSKYDSEYILAGDVTFYATNTRVYQTESLEKPYSNGKMFIPAFAVVNPSLSVYALNVNNYHASYYGSYDAGSWFISNLRKVYPFEAYMTTSSSNARTLSIEFEDDATGIDEVPRRNIKGGVVKVYTLTGLLVFSAPQSEFAERWSDLPSGVYIVNGKKMIKTDDAQSNVVQ